MSYNVGIYCRLSREDLKNGKQDNSVSIENQKAMLMAYAEKQGWAVYKPYVDDDVTGTTFNRPGLNEMMNDVESGEVNCVIIKDLSRFGRNRIESALHREKFLSLRVRFIAIEDNCDNLDELNQTGSYDMLTPLKEMINEMYAADVSRKVRSVKRLMAEQGKFANSRAPYGYMKSPEDKHVLIVDENVAHNVTRIFDLYLGGETGRAIADVFNQEGILPPNEYYYSTINKPNPYHNNKNCWGSATIMNIIKNPVYYGAMANGKRNVTSFKDKRVKRKPFNEWTIIENTHTAIVPKEKWSMAQKTHEENDRQGVKRRCNGEISIFAGIAKCSDCGGGMVFNRKEYKSYTKEFYRCSTYNQKGKEVCPPHIIDYDVLYQAVLDDIKQYAVLGADDEDKLINKILKSNDEFKTRSLSRYEKNIRESQNRIREIDGLMLNLFEEKIAGNVTDVMFKRLSGKYEEEQARLITLLEQLENEFAECKRQKKDISGYVKRIKECLSIDSLTRDIVVELIDKIEVSETYDTDGERNIDISISYKFGKSDYGRGAGTQKKIELTGTQPLKDVFPISSIA